MEHFSPDDLFSYLPDADSPGAQVHLYRLLHLLATQGASDSDALPVSYAGAKKIAVRLGINTPDRLIKLFKYMGFGELSLEIQPALLRASVAAMEQNRAYAPEVSNQAKRKHLCEFQRGLIDGALEQVTCLPVISGESQCCLSGSGRCVFEAVRDEVAGRGYVPASDSGAWRGSGFTSSTPQGMRAWFMELAGREMARAKRHHRRLSLLYVDIDDLGEINSSHGRATGDELISVTGNAISRTCRTEDFLWHHGEDEFAIILAETDAATAAKVAERLAIQIRMAAELIDVSTTLSACIGFATFPDDGQTVFDLLKNAKSALYMAKAAGKGEVRYAAPASGERPGDPEPSADKKERRQAKADAGASNLFSGIRDVNEAVREYQLAAVPDEPDSSRTGPVAKGRGYTVALASASHLVLSGMKHELEAEAGIVVAGEFVRPNGLITFIEDVRPDIVLADTQIATAEDYALPRFIEVHNLPCKLVIIVEDANADVVKLAADFKVEGMVLQNSAPADLIKALDTVYEGRSVMPEKIRTTLSELKSGRLVLGELSDRELEVLRLVADGKSNAQISDVLFITVNTVRFHLANIYQKLSVSNRTEAANYFLRQDIPPEDQARLL